MLTECEASTIFHHSILHYVWLTTTISLCLTDINITVFDWCQHHYFWLMSTSLYLTDFNISVQLACICGFAVVWQYSKPYTCIVVCVRLSFSNEYSHPWVTLNASSLERKCLKYMQKSNFDFVVFLFSLGILFTLVSCKKLYADSSYI